jgi:hypothetical protein
MSAMEGTSHAQLGALVGDAWLSRLADADVPEFEWARVPDARRGPPGDLHGYG